MFDIIQKNQNNHSLTHVQPKMEIGKEDDEQEKEADTVADKVMKMSIGSDSGEDNNTIRKMRDTSGVNKMSDPSALKKMKDPWISMKKMPVETIRKMSTNTSSGISVPKHVETGISNSKGNGNSLTPALQQEMGTKMGADLSGVNIHNDNNAVEMSNDIGAKAFTHGSDIYFNKDQYDPSSNKGKHLLAHELTHTVQQEGSVRKKIQRSALATWEDASPKDQKDLFDLEAGKKDKNKYNDQENARQIIKKYETQAPANKTEEKELNNAKKLLSKAEEKGKIVSLPIIDKILKVNANYHYNKETPSGDPRNPFKFTPEVKKEVEKKLRMSNESNPAFWPHIKWIDSKGDLRDIGVKLNIQFIEETVTGKQDMNDEGIPKDLENLDNVKKNPWDNPFAFTTIDQLTEKSYFDLEAFCRINGLTNIKFTQDANQRDIVEYTDPDGKKIIYDSNQLFEIKQAVRAEWARLKPVNPADDIKSNVLGLGNSNMVMVDPSKSGPPESETFKKYRKFPSLDKNGYYDSVKEKFNETTKNTYSPDQRNKMIANVITHEIGHNIGMAHSDFGVMNKSSEEMNYSTKQVTIGQFQNDQAGMQTVMKEGQYSIQAQEDSLVFADASIVHANIQKLVNRIKIMTENVKARDTNTGVLNDVTGLWSKKLSDLEKYLKAKNYVDLFKDPFLVSLLAIPYGKPLSNTDDMLVIQEVQKKGFLMTLTDWNKLSVETQDSINTETLDTYSDRKSVGTGHTFFESVEEMNKF